MTGAGRGGILSDIPGVTAPHCKLMMRTRYLNPCVYTAGGVLLVGLAVPILRQRGPDVAVATERGTAIGHAAGAAKAIAAVLPPDDPRVPLELEESVTLAQRKRIMGRKLSLEMVRRVATRISPLVVRALEMPSIQGDLEALAASAGLSPPEYKQYWQAKQEADLLLESGGNPSAVSVSNAIGVAQFLASTGRSCGLRINEPAARAVTRRMAPVAAALRWLDAQPAEWGKPDPATGVFRERDWWIAARRSEWRVLEASRRAADERYDPAKAICAQTRYLVRLARRYGSVAWALQAYHGGEGGMAKTVNLYLFNSPSMRLMGDPPAYEEIYAHTSPLNRSGAFYYLYGRSDDHRYYWWKVLMAERAIALYRASPEGFRERWEALRPGFRMEVAWFGEGADLQFADRAALRQGVAEGQLVPVPGDLSRRRIRLVDVAPLDRTNAGDYKVLRAEAMGALLRIAALYRRNGGRGPVEVLSLAQTVETAEERKRLHPARVPVLPTGEVVAEQPEFHATGLVFDLARPRDEWDRRVLEYVLGFLYDRLRISWQKEDEHGPTRYHVVPNPVYREEFVSEPGVR